MASSCYPPSNESYGIIVIRFSETNKPYFLCGRRRDSYEYVDFIRGNCYPSQHQTLVNNMTEREKYRLRNWSFDDIWNDLWVKHIGGYITQYNKCCLRFLQLKKDGEIDRLLNECTTFVDENIWEFPKGHRFKNETSKETALREFQEETRISPALINIFPIPSINEKIKGTDGLPYKTNYHIATNRYVYDHAWWKHINVTSFRSSSSSSKSLEEDDEYKKRQKTISVEFDDLGWFTLDRLKYKLSSDRYKTAEKALELVKKYHEEEEENKCNKTVSIIPETAIIANIFV